MKAPKKATLEGCYAKLARAEQLIQELDRVNRRFFRRHTPVVAIVKHPTTSRQELIATDVKAPPVAHSIIVGDVLYNLRSCLDHLVHQLIVAHTGKEPTYRTYEFPVFETEKAFDDNLNRLLRDVSPDGVRRVRQVQPFTFTRPTDTALYALNELGLVDKHRVPLLAVIRGRVSAMTADDENTSILWAGGGHDGLVEDGAVLATFDSRVSPKMDLNAIAEFDMALADGPHDLPVTRFLSMIWRVVAQMLDHIGGVIDPAEVAAETQKREKRIGGMARVSRPRPKKSRGGRKKKP
jgi:hypothetical protein